MSFRNAKGGYIRPGYDPLEVANPPTGASATAGSASASVSFTAPSNTGGGAITNYYAVSNPGQITASSVTSPISVTGLTNGTEYTFKVWGENSYGPSAYSAPTGAVTPVPNYIEDVFSTYLFTGTGGTQTITNSINLSSEGGLVWTKRRDASSSHGLYDTLRGTTKRLRTNTSDAEDTLANSVTAFNTDGFSIGSQFANAETYASWTFRKAEKFFDVVTYTGNGTTQTINHNLGSIPGCIIVKSASSGSYDWGVYHRSLGATKGVYLNTTQAEQTNNSLWNDTTPTSTQFTVGNSGGASSSTNANGVTYVAYLFAHDAGGFGLTGTDSVISCGSFTTDASGRTTVTLNYEPQWLLVKRTSGGTGNWEIADNMRGWTVSGNASLYPNLSNAENNPDNYKLNATGFSADNGAGSSDFIYIAIRRGPMKTPTTGTSVFVPQVITESTTGLNTITSNFPVDWVFTTTSDTARRWGTRLPGNQTLATSSISAETNFGTQATAFDSNTTAGIIGTAGSPVAAYMYAFRRAPGFFDVVCYTGTGSATTFSHNLGVTPELMIVKKRSTSGAWITYWASLGATKYLVISDQPAGTLSIVWNDTAPTSSVFTVGTDASLNASGSTYVNYLFATVAGVSKVGSYTGTGTTLQVNCGFTSGARFVLIKRTDDTGDWYVYDSARGIVSGNDPYFFMNSTLTAVTNTDYVDTYSAGFEISSTAPAAINANGGTYIFLAIA